MESAKEKIEQAIRTIKGSAIRLHSDNELLEALQAGLSAVNELEEWRSGKRSYSILPTVMKQEE